MLSLCCTSGWSIICNAIVCFLSSYHKDRIYSPKRYRLLEKYCLGRWFSRELYLHPRPLGGEFWGRSRESRYSTIQNKKRQPYELSFFCFGAENETLSICSPLCISSNYLCPVLYPKFEGHLGCFRVSFSSPTFAIQTSELQLLMTNLRIIFELTKSKRDGLYL